MRRPVIFLLIAALAVSTAHAEKLYKWIGKDGKISYQDRPPPSDAGTVQEKDLAGRRTGATSDSEGGSAAAQKYPVVLYSVPKCNSCDDARAYLKKRHIPFSDKNVENNPSLQKELKDKAGQLSVPTLTVGSKVMDGYVQSLLAGELDQAGYPKEGKPAAEGEAGGDNQGAAPQENSTP